MRWGECAGVFICRDCFNRPDLEFNPNISVAFIAVCLSLNQGLQICSDLQA